MKAPTIDFCMEMSRLCKYETFPQVKHSPNNKKLHLSYFVVKVSFHSLPRTLKITVLLHLRKFGVTPPSYSDVELGEHNQTHHQHKFNYPVGEMHWDEIGSLPPTSAHTSPHFYPRHLLHLIPSSPTHTNSTKLSKSFQVLLSPINSICVMALLWCCQSTHCKSENGEKFKWFSPNLYSLQCRACNAMKTLSVFIATLFIWA